MMREETARNIEILREKVGNRPFCDRDCKGIVSISTLRKYNLIEHVTIEVERKELSLDELIAEINDMVGEDCYYCDGEYINDNGRIFYIRNEDGYRFKD